MERVFIPNRGEIAVRIIRACHALGLESVVGHSTADRESLPCRLADQAICIGGPRSVESYLSIERVVAAALATRCDALHPGYGFLAESPGLAAACAEHGLTFVGPSSTVIEQMADKSAARAAAQDSGVPVLPGSGPIDALDELGGQRFDYPVLVKAVAGGGGRGMRLAATEQELVDAFELGRREATAAFGDGRLYVEQFVPRARHLEVQVLADQGGAALHVGDRECSVQRRSQKLLEESPAVIDTATRQQLADAALAITRDIGYVNAGTVEFVYDEDRGQPWFIEMNTRLQVEHPVTEMVSGVDLVTLQLRIAAGEALPFRQADVVVDGHAIEWRVLAESVDAGFVPQPGRIKRWVPPQLPWTRVDTHCYPGYDVPPFYDSLLAKLVARGRTREEAVERLARAAAAFEVDGVPTTLGLCERVLGHEDFVNGSPGTRWLEGLLAGASHE